MPRFLVSIHHPLNYNPSESESDQMRQEIDDLNDEMVAAGVRLFVGGLYSANEAVSLLPSEKGVQRVNGPYLQSKENIGGLWVLEVADKDEALSWAEKAAKACRVPVEVRQFH